MFETDYWKRRREENRKRQEQMMDSEAWNFESRDEIRCPACGAYRLVDFEDSFYYTEDIHETECYECGAIFDVKTVISVTYESVAKTSDAK